MSAPNEQARTAIPASVGRLLPDGRRVYRLATPLVVWWVWVGLAVLTLGDLLIQGHDYLSVKFALGMLTVTGLVFACTLWSKVIADDDGITVRNPFRVFTIPWAAVRGIFLADSVEIQCSRGPQKKDKTVYTWALSATRRTRARAKLHGWQWEQGKRSRPASYGQLPEDAKELVKMSPTEVMAREMAQLNEGARARLSEDDGPGEISLNGSGPASAATAEGGHVGTGSIVTASWAWPALAAILLPGIAFVISVLAR